MNALGRGDGELDVEGMEQGITGQDALMRRSNGHSCCSSDSGLQLGASPRRLQLGDN